MGQLFSAQGLDAPQIKVFLWTRESQEGRPS